MALTTGLVPLLGLPHGVEAGWKTRLRVNIPKLPSFMIYQFNSSEIVQKKQKKYQR
jgi:hypothetical protein